MAVTLNQNQFALATLKGTKYAGHECSVMTVEFYSATGTDTIEPGVFVVPSSQTAAGQVLKVAVGANASADFLGVVLTNPMKQSFAVGDKMEIGIFQSIVLLEASAAIAAGANVEFTPASGKCVTRSTGTIVARAIEPAAADGSQFRALIKTI